MLRGMFKLKYHTTRCEVAPILGSNRVALVRNCADVLRNQVPVQYIRELSDSPPQHLLCRLFSRSKTERAWRII